MATLNDTLIDGSLAINGNLNVTGYAAITACDQLLLTTLSSNGERVDVRLNGTNGPSISINGGIQYRILTTNDLENMTSYGSSVTHYNSANANNLLNTGKAECFEIEESSSNSNFPLTDNTSRWYMTTIGSNTAGYGVQTAYRSKDGSNVEAWVRKKTNGTWNPWHKYALDTIPNDAAYRLVDVNTNMISSSSPAIYAGWSDGKAATGYETLNSRVRIIDDVKGSNTGSSTVDAYGRTHYKAKYLAAMAEVRHPTESGNIVLIKDVGASSVQVGNSLRWDGYALVSGAGTDVNILYIY